MPARTILEYDIEDDWQPTPVGCERELLGLTSGLQPLVIVTTDGITGRAYGRVAWAEKYLYQGTWPLVRMVPPS